MIQQNKKCPVCRTVPQSMQLIHLPNGRYGCQNSDGKVLEFSCGHSVDVLVRDGDILKWLPTRFEHDGRDYYLVGCPKIPLNGLTVRERRGQE